VRDLHWIRRLFKANGKRRSVDWTRRAHDYVNGKLRDIARCARRDQSQRKATTANVRLKWQQQLICVFGAAATGRTSKSNISLAKNVTRYCQDATVKIWCAGLTFCARQYANWNRKENEGLGACKARISAALRARRNHKLRDSFPAVLAQRLLELRAYKETQVRDRSDARRSCVRCLSHSRRGHVA